MNNDRRTVHIVVVFIGLIALTLAAGMLVLNAQSIHIDPVLSTLGAGALGSLGTLLASTKGNSSADPTSVSVVNDTPIPVTETAQDTYTGKHESEDSAVGTDLPTVDLTGGT
jgi:hypothetical protein